MKNDTTKYRLTQVEETVNGLDTKIDDIMNNHLPHINERVVKNETWIKVATVINVGAIILATLISRLL
jgi:hypothetical protein